VLVRVLFGSLAVLSLAFNLWQWLAARRFPLHRRTSRASQPRPISLLKPLSGLDEATETCLRSWFCQDYPAPVQILFAVASEADPVCTVVRKLIAEFPRCDARLAICQPTAGANAKVAKLVELERLAAHEILVVSDADVRVEPDFLLQLTAPLAEPKTGLVNCFYQLANPSTAAMRWEAVAINADFWSQVLQSQDLKPLDFALGAVLATRRQQLAGIGGFQALVNCLADDYQLGNRIAQLGFRIVLCPVVVECWSDSMTWSEVWKHQLRWARTIRVCQPIPYFFSILSNPILWPLLWVVIKPSAIAVSFGLLCLVARTLTAAHLQARLTRQSAVACLSGFPLLKDLLQVGIWALAFAGNHVEWRGVRMRLLRDGTLVPVKSSRPRDDSAST
jgi:ceramide glucosyltransferase